MRLELTTFIELCLHPNLGTQEPNIRPGMEPLQSRVYFDFDRYLFDS
jgi:hypothetical protein